MKNQQYMDQSGKNRATWRAMESECAKTDAERSVDNVIRRENPAKSNPTSTLSIDHEEMNGSI